MTLPAKTTEADIIESVIAKGDLGKLSPQERTTYYVQLCKSLGLNPHTQPFAYLTLSGKLTLYAKRDAADQLRKINGISIAIVSQEQADGLLIDPRQGDRQGWPQRRGPRCHAVPGDNLRARRAATPYEMRHQGQAPGDAVDQRARLPR